MIESDLEDKQNCILEVLHFYKEIQTMVAGYVK